MIKYLQRLFSSINFMNFKDIADMALAGEFLSRLINEYLDILIEKNKLKKPTEEEIQRLREKVIKDMQEKYPSAGIVLKKREKK